MPNKENRVIRHVATMMLNKRKKKKRIKNPGAVYASAYVYTHAYIKQGTNIRTYVREIARVPSLN